MKKTVYQRALGPDFEKLHPHLQRIHSAEHGSLNKGVFNVTRGKGWLRNLVATLMGLLPQGKELPTTLLIRPNGEKERWSRSFGKASFDSTHRAEGGYLIESVGPVSLAFQMGAPDGSMTMDCVRVYFLGIPIPKWLSPTTDAVATPNETGWHVLVRMGVPILGELVRYEGTVETVEVFDAPHPEG